MGHAPWTLYLMFLCFFFSLLFSRGICAGSGIKPDAPPIIRDISHSFQIYLTCPIDFLQRIRSYGVYGVQVGSHVV
jgi:hypothetical protein